MVAYECSRHKGVMALLLPRDTTEFVGSSMTSFATGEAIGRDVHPKNS